MALSARLEQVRKLAQADIDALPDQPVPPIPETGYAGDDEVLGGVLLELTPPQSLLSPTISPSKQSTFTCANSHIQVAQPVDRSNSGDRFIWAKGAESAYNLGTSRLPTNPCQPAVTPAVTGLQQGDLVPAHHRFTPILALAKYPYKFCNRDQMQEIASIFFDQGKFWEQTWDLFYVWDLEPTKPIILVCESQFQAFLEKINSHLQLSLKITYQQRKDGLVSCFPDHQRCLPRYLGRSNSRQEFNIMVENTPSSTFRAVGEPSHAPLDCRSLEDFKNLMEELWDIQKAKNKASKAKKQQERLMKQKAMTDQFKRAQRYLGLRPSVTYSALHSIPPKAIDPTICAPFPFEQSVVFVCVDVESYERAHHKITEIGVATLDTHDLVGVAPGEDGINWRKKIRARHFRINEYRHLVNSEFVTGHPDSFDFGQSTPTPLKDAAQYVASCFNPPFGAHDGNATEDIATVTSRVDGNEKRNLIFLGHDTLGDIRYLQQLGYDPIKVENILEALDTAVMYRVWRREQQSTNLGRILMAFDIAGFNLHNAGNDAVFTVQVMLAICVREATIRGSSELDNMRNEEMAARLASAIDDAKQRAFDEAEGWSDNEVDDDGGVPVPLAATDTPRQPSAHHDSLFSPDSDVKGRGRGRGLGDRSRVYRAPRENYRGGRYRGTNGGRGGSERGDYGSSGRGNIQGRGRLDGRAGSSGYGRGRGCGSIEITPGNDPASSQVTFHW
ncbi:hypothetical protein BKA66DRAFT_312052 [Pyrenochaeta sp. MPI-SDFR-AT-0127]|nr:hypothetical protein BKA66DRAFT_312052 [Pyrenochaeta sp. MPI-SDFR-AT-0127]